MILNHRIFVITAFLPLYVNAMHWYLPIKKEEEMYSVRSIQVLTHLRYQHILKRNKSWETLGLLLSLSSQEKETHFIKKMPQPLIFELCKFLNGQN